jgi:hypothetical protein
MSSEKPTPPLAPPTPSERSERDDALTKARTYFVVDPRKVTGKDLYERILAMREEAPRKNV